jgi:hypothetical protein
MSEMAERSRRDRGSSPSPGGVAGEGRAAAQVTGRRVPWRVEGDRNGREPQKPRTVWWLWLLAAVLSS